MKQCLLQMQSSLLSFFKCTDFLLVKGTTLKSEETKVAYLEQQIQPSAREMGSLLPYAMVTSSVQPVIHCLHLPGTLPPHKHCQ